MQCNAAHLQSLALYGALFASDIRIEDGGYGPRSAGSVGAISSCPPHLPSNTVPEPMSRPLLTGTALGSYSLHPGLCPVPTILSIWSQWLQPGPYTVQSLVVAGLLRTTVTCNNAANGPWYYNTAHWWHCYKWLWCGLVPSRQRSGPGMFRVQEWHDRKG